MWYGVVEAKIQDQTTEPIKFSLMSHVKDDITLTADVAVNDTIVNVSAGHGFVIGHTIVIWCDGYYIQSIVTNVATNAITIDRRIDRVFAMARSRVIRGVTNFGVNGSVTPVEFKFACLELYQPIDLYSINISMYGAGTPDDGKFGGITAITKGLEIRMAYDGVAFNLGNFTANHVFRDYGANVVYTDKAPGGVNGVNINFRLKEIYGVVPRIYAGANSRLYLTVRDDLSGITECCMSLHGHYTEGN